jgi:hypothetical protein
MKTFAIITPLLLEHNYINYFAEYHINLGFDKIYFLVDDLDFIQDDYIINNKTIEDKIKFINMTSYTSDEEIKHFSLYHKSGIVHKIIQNFYPDVSEQYTILLGVDSFLFLNNLTIQEFFTTHNIEDSVCQVFFKWISISNNSVYKYNLMENINEYNKQYNYHYFTLGNKELVVTPTGDSHHYIVNNQSNITWFDGNTLLIDNKDNFHQILDKIGSETNECNTKFGCIYHFVCRDIYDVLIKTYYYWKREDMGKVLIRDIILNNINKDHDRMAYFFNFTNTINYCKEVILNISNNNEDVEYNKKYIFKMLSECEISEEEFTNWLNIL